MIIGGAQIYAMAMTRAARIYLTEVQIAPDGDVFFSDLDRDDWLEVARLDHEADGEVPAFSFVTLERAV
jgi:dihydrofolate reductase